MRLVLGALAMAGLIDAAGAQGAPSLRAPPPPDQQRREAPGDLGMAIMSARVQNDGVLLNGAGAISSVRTQAGVYEVTFGRNIEECAPVTTSTFVIGLSYVVVTRDSTATVITLDNRTQAYRDSNFSIILYCHK